MINIYTRDWHTNLKPKEKTLFFVSLLPSLSLSLAIPVYRVWWGGEGEEDAVAFGQKWEVVMAPACGGGAVTCMATAMMDAIHVGFSYLLMLAVVATLLVMCLDMYGKHQTVVGAVVEGKKKKKEKTKSKVDVIEALVKGEEGGVVGFVGEESVVDKDGGLAVKGGDLVQTELFDGSLVMEGGDLEQTECSDGRLVVEGGDLEQTECVDGRLVVKGGDSDGSLVVKGSDLEQIECSVGSVVVERGDLEQTKWFGDGLVVEDGGLEQTECFDGRLVVEGGDLKQTEFSDDSLVVKGGDLEQTECSDDRLVVEGDDLEQTECSDGEDVVFGDGAVDGGRGVEVEDGEDEEEVFPSQGEDDDDDDDDWEGIEKSDLGERFGSLASFMASEAGEALLGTVGSDVRLQLYALHKVAVEGPCYNRPALVLTSYARAKWFNLYFVPLCYHCFLFSNIQR